MIGLKLFPVYVATLLQLYYGTSGTPFNIENSCANTQYIHIQTSDSFENC